MRSRRITAICVVINLVGCSDTGSNEQWGGLLGAGTGAALGGILGHSLGHSTGATLLGAGGGAVAGLLIGGAIGRHLDSRDQQRASQATAAALQTGSSRSWKSDHSDSSGKVTVLNTTKTTHGECRNVRETAYVKGEQVAQDVKYCRNADGEWVAA